MSEEWANGSRSGLTSSSQLNNLLRQNTESVPPGISNVRNQKWPINAYLILENTNVNSEGPIVLGTN